MRTVQTDDAPAAIGPYVQARVADGVVYCSGQIGVTPDGELVDGVEQQAGQALDNLAAVLATAGCGWADVVRVRVYLADMDDYDAINDVYADRGDGPPARVAVEVSDLPADALVEIEATAVQS